MTRPGIEPQVSRTIGEHSTHLVNEPVYIHNVAHQKNNNSLHLAQIINYEMSKSEFLVVKCLRDELYTTMKWRGSFIHQT